MNILFVCTGNTCRSVMAEGIFKKILIENDVKDVIPSSAGISTLNGLKASTNAIVVCKEIGVDISQHVSTSIINVDMDSIDFFVAVSHSHAKSLKSLGVEDERLYVLGDIEDPFSKDEQCYRRCRDIIQGEVEKVWNFLKIRLN